MIEYTVMKHFISPFSAGTLLAVMIISSCELPAEAGLEAPGKSVSTSIMGTVTNPAGDGVKGVHLSAGGVLVESDKHGDFTLEGVARIDTVTLIAKKAGYKDYSKPIALPRGRVPAQDIELDYAYKTTVHGKLSGLEGLDEKSGIPIKSSTGGEPVLTNADGKYTIEVEHAGEFTLIAVVHDKGLIGTSGFTPAVTPQKPVSEETAAKPIELEEAVVSFTLELKDPLGNAVTGYEAKDFTSNSRFPDVKIDDTATAPPEGSYPLQVNATESFTVTVAAKGLFGEKKSAEINPAAAAGTNYPVRVPYQYTTTLEGRVTSGGAPIAGAKITVASQGSGAEERRAVVTRSRQTNRDGRYRIEVNHQGPFKYQAEKSGYKSSPQEFSMEKNTDGKYKFTGSPQVGRDIELTVTQDLTGLSYGVSTLELAENEALTADQLAALQPTITPAGARVTYSVDPPLPAGLTLDPSNGRITGKPTAIMAAGDYVVTAKGNTADGYSGSASHTITIRVGAVTRFTLELKDPLGNPIPGYTAAHFKLSSGAAVEFDTTAPTVPPGIYPLQVLTSGSGPLTVTVAARGLFGEKEFADIDPAMIAGKHYSAAVPYRYTTTVSGNVTKGTTGAGLYVATPIEDADIRVTSTGSGANERLAAIIYATASRNKTNRGGYYAVTVNHQGDFHIRAEKAGYNSTAVPVTHSWTSSDFHNSEKNIALTQTVTGLSYGVKNLVLAQNQDLTDAQKAALRPTTTPNNASVEYSIKPPRLPAGLRFNNYSGEIEVSTPREESQFSYNGAGYRGLDYVVTATGRAGDGYIGSAKYTINIRVGKALPDNMGYKPAMLSPGNTEIDRELKLIDGGDRSPLGLADEDFHAEFVKIPKTAACYALSITANGHIKRNRGKMKKINGELNYRVKVTGKGRYAGTRIVDFKIGNWGDPASPYGSYTCYE